MFVDRSALGLQPKLAPASFLKGDLFEVLPQAEQPKEKNRIALVGVIRKDLRLECKKIYVKKLTVTKAESLLALSSAELRYEKSLLPIQDVGQQVVQSVSNSKTIYITLFSSPPPPPLPASPNFKF